MKTVARNRRARYDYEPLETMEAGIKLIGAEVKSVKAGNISLKGAFVSIHDGEAYLTNATIPPSQPANAPSDYEPTRSRKLLVSKQQLSHLIGSKQNKGLTLIPIRVYIKGPHIKVEIALARGKKRHDKKQTKKELDIKREVDRLLRGKE